MVLVLVLGNGGRSIEVVGLQVLTLVKELKGGGAYCIKVINFLV